MLWKGWNLMKVCFKASRHVRTGLAALAMATAISSVCVPVAWARDNANSGTNDLIAQLLDRVSTLEQQQRDMRGEIDQLTNELQQKTAALSKQIADNQFAAQANAGAAGASTAAASTDTTPKEDAKPTTPDGLLASGKAALQKKDYAEAQSDAESALKNAKGAFKVDAQFLLAQSLAGQKQYRQSAVAYYDAYRQAPKSGRAPDALLGVSASLLALGDKKASCEALSKLKAEFPTPSTRVAHAAEVYAKRGSCE
ncbi:hypothetical protein [Acetobacter pasteurianus]|uniref:hypothetical protein n=1 Tax=Acetobacter pasteurianus TaxID=438 RepID=UPI003D0B6D6A